MSLGEQVLQIYDELRSYPLLKKRGYETCELLGDVLVDSRSGTASFRLNAKRYTFRCFDFFISGLAGGLRSVRLGLFDQDGKQLFDGTLPGHFEVFHSDEWVADFTALHSQIVLLVGKRRIRDPYSFVSFDDDDDKA